VLHLNGGNYAVQAHSNNDFAQGKYTLYYDPETIRNYNFSNQMVALNFWDEPYYVAGSNDPHMMDHLPEITAFYNTNRTAYPNALLYSSTAGLRDTWGTEAGLREYMRTCHPDMLMYDVYPGFSFGDRDKWFSNMATFRRVALEGYDGTGNAPIVYGQFMEMKRSSYTANLPSESFVRMQRFASLAAGCTYLSDYRYTSTSEKTVLFNQSGQATPVYGYVAQANQEIRNLSNALARLVSVDLRLMPGRNQTANGTGITAWNAGAGGGDYMTSIMPTVSQGGADSTTWHDVLFGYFRPLRSDNSDYPYVAGGQHFMMVNCAPGQQFAYNNANGDPASNSAQWYHMTFDTLTTGYNALERVRRDRDTSNPNDPEFEIVPLTSLGGSQFALDYNLTGGTGDLFRYVNNPTAQYFGSGSGSSWDNSTSSNWAGASGGPYNSKWASGSNAHFEGTGRSVTVGSISAVNSIGFDSSGYTLNSGAIHLTGDGKVTVNSGTAAIASHLTGSVGLTKLGAGTLVLGPGSSNSYTGLTKVLGGTLALATAPGQWAVTGDVALGNGTTDTNLSLWAAHQIPDSAMIYFYSGNTTDKRAKFNLNGNDETVGGITSGNDDLSVIQHSETGGTGLGTLTVQNDTTDCLYGGIIRDRASGTSGTLGLSKRGAKTLILCGSNANTYSGATNVYEGALLLEKTPGVNAVGGGVSIGTGTNEANLTLGASNQIPDTASIYFSSGGSGQSAKFNLGGHSETVGGISSAGGASVIQNAETNGSGTSILTVNNTTDCVYDGIIRDHATGGAGALALVKSGAAKLTLRNAYSGSNSYSGGTTLNGGTLCFANGTLGATGNITFNGGVLQWDTGNTQDISGRIADVPSGKAAIVDTNGNSVAFASAVTGAGGLTKAGAGALTLTATSSYTGTTTINGGTLFVNGSILTSSGVNSAGAATLGGYGRVSAISMPGLVSPGTARGILTANSVDSSSGVDFAFELGQTGSPSYGSASASGNDVLRLTSSAPIGGNMTSANHMDIYLRLSSVTHGDQFQGGLYLDNGADFLSSIQDTSISYFVLGNGSGTHFFNGDCYYTLAELYPSWSVSLATVRSTANFGSGNIDGRVMQFTVAPEPGTALLLFLGLVGLLGYGHRVRPTSGKHRIGF
jgi:autotransporter-associated beta strand protein